ncbi:hypothetical protein HG535_0A01660 [Zygotorulaspora mrakii]|uniref:Pre-mRNA-splicing factor SPF27 n=1 Tax=Zygotorulaspora mrakii TaxID=42260 RepID=A0A7H9AV88_ZYGMR|nr:uncharacterized protein HG535_0A01660 [Zygotorulaspora mrakii]QLG70228.1 hypothetical protein HG535_0A01660 [Zygotorulaspora mrakii]
MDYLPFIDEPQIDDTHLEKVETRMKLELERIMANDQIHPEVLRLLESQPHKQSRFDEELYELYNSGSENVEVNGSARKRPYNEELLLEEHKKKNARVRMDIYDLDNPQCNVERLAIIDNYLKHQELILREALPKTLLNQWAINNHYLSNRSEQLQQVIDLQSKHIQELNAYRKNVQLQNEPVFERDVQNWRNKLIRNLNVQ